MAKINYGFNLIQGIYIVTMNSESCKDLGKIIIGRENS
jgi:hypothetical protein